MAYPTLKKKEDDGDEAVKQFLSARSGNRETVSSGATGHSDDSAVKQFLSSRSKATEGTTMRSKLQSALSDVRGAIERQEPQEPPLTPAQQAAQQAADQTRHDIDAIQRRVDHLRGVSQSGDLRESRRAEQEIRALQGLYQRATTENQRANDFLSGTRRERVTEDQVRAASDALTQAKSNALSASLRLGSALTVRGQNPFSDTDENIQRMVSEAQEYSASAHAAEQEATATYNKLAGDYQYQKYAGLRMRPDFLMNSYGDAETANHGAESTDAAEIAYARIYGRDHATAKPDNLSGDIYRYVTDDEARLFYYLWNTQGKKAASEYLKSVEYQINERLAAEQQERINKLTETTAGKVYASAASVLLNQGSIIGVVDLTMQNIRRMLGDNRPIDYNTQAQAIGKAAQQIRANVSENLEGNTKTQLFGITNLAAFLYQTGMSMADSSLQLVLNRFGVPEPVTLALMSGGAAQQAVYDAKERGASDGQALLAGYAAGIAEYAFEKISLDKLVGSIEAKAGETIGEKLTEKWTSNLAKKVGAGILNAGQQGIVEGSEEAFTTLANTVTDLMINGDKSELLKDIDEMGTGPALRKWITGLALDAMGGIISGVGMGAGGNVLRYAGGVAEDAASAARAAAEKESGQAQAETPAQPETRTAPPTPSESNPLAKALDKLRSGEQLTKNDARRIIEDEASMQTLRDAGLELEIRPGRDGREQIRQAVESYARLNTNLLTQAQAQGNLETNTEEVVSNGRTVETPDRATAETAGEQQPQTSFRERARAAAETQRSREILDRAERRSGLGRFLAEYRANRAQRSAESQFDEQNRRANSLRNQAEARNLTFTSAAEQGVPGGTEEQTFQVMPADMLDRNMRTAQQEAAKNGIDLRFMIGQGRVNDSSGNYNFRGWISADGKRMLIQADHSKLTWQQILDHEELHKLIKSAPGYRQAVEDALLSDARLQPYLSSIVDRYAEAYNSLGVTDENEIIEELLADYRAGFDMLDIARSKAGDVRTKATAKKDIRAVERRGVVPTKNNRGAQTQGSTSTEITSNRFSMEMPVEETADLIAVHNLTERNLIDMGELGGAPAPSIAIVKAEAGHNKFGPISLVYTKDTIDPQADWRNRVYGSDAWTPTAPRVDYEMNYSGVLRLEDRIESLSKSIADGIFANSSILRQAGIDDSTTMNIDELTEKLAGTDAVKAAYLADRGETMEPVKKAKEWGKYGNSALQKLIDKIGPQRLAQINSDLWEGVNTSEALGEDAETIRRIIREYYAERDEAFLQKRAQRNGWTKEETDAQRQKHLDDVMKKKVSTFTLEDFARDAWAMYEDGGATQGEYDYLATQSALRDAVSDKETADWIRPQLESIYGRRWLYNGKDPFTASGSSRSFRQLHDPYTLENIVKAMSGRQDQRGNGLWGATATGLQATASPSYSSIRDIKADSGRLGAVSEEEYNARVSAVDQKLEEIISEIAGPGSRFGDREIVGSLLIDAAKGSKTVAAIRNLFARESEFTVSEAAAKKIQRLFKDAAKLPTEYFEAKPMRAVGFDEIAAAVVPSDISAQARKVLDDNGVNTLEYRSGDEADRLAKLNSIPDVKFSRELDRDYLTAVESGDMDTAQRMVDEAARAAGYTVKAYHGTTDDFTKFSRGEQGRNHDGYLEFGGGFYFTPSENEAREWVRRGRSGLSGKAELKVMSVYLSPRNIINADEPIPRGAEALQRMGMSKAEANFIAGRTYRFINYLAEDKGFSNTEIQDELKSLGYDAIDATYRNTASGQYVVFDPEQIKSADPVTYDDQGNVIPLSERFNTQDDDIRFSREIDDEYMAAVNSGEEWKAERMVRDAALTWGAETNENGKPLDLYHGTPRFGFTTYDMGRETASKGMIYTTTKREVSANYAGRDHYAGTRPIGTRFIENATRTKDIIQNAKSVYESDYHVMTGAEKAEVREKVEADVNALMERYEALKDRDKLFQWDDEDYSFTNALAWVEDLFYTVQGNRENYDSAGEYRNALDDDLERFERNLERVRNYLSEHYKELQGTDAYRFLTGYDVFDLYVDIAESYRKVLRDGELIQSKTGNIQVPAELQEAMEGIHNIGAYHLYGNLGQNPATVDAEHRDWLTVKAPEIMGDDKYHSTDAIAKKAREQGYTGLVVKNVYDGGVEADDYIFFNADQVKSADPVTYDDNGQVIPITERFNPENPDIRYSREIDPQEIAKAEYLTEQRRSGRTGGRGRKKVSRVRTHAFELGGLYNEVEAQMAETQPGEFTYDPISEKRSMDEALGRLRKDFTGEAKKLASSDQWGGSDLDTAMGILYQYRQIGRDTGDYSLFNEWSHVIQEKGTKGGQFVQAFAKYSRTATERARKAAEDLRETTGKLTPAEQKRVQGHVDELLGAIDGAAEEAAREAVEGQKGLQLPTATGDNQKTKDALNIIKEIHDIFALRSSKSHGVPVEDWTKETGDRLADRIASRLREPTTKTQTTMQTILSDLVTFAQEHALPTQEARQHRTALDRITDYLNNREAYAEAWDEAKQVLRDMYADDEEKLEALESFLNATISYNGEDFDRTMYRAILESADLLGMSKQDILDLAAAGTTDSVIDRIADEFIRRVGTDDETLRDTVARHINNLVMENNVGRRLERMENEASKALDIKLQELLRESRRTKADAANAIAQYLINERGISGTDAAIAADHIAGHYMTRLEQRAARELERMFAEKGEKIKPKQRDKLLDLIRLGGLTNANVEDAVVDALGLGKLSRSRQREITATMAQLADLYDAIEDDDPEGLRSLIRQQAAARNTKLDRMAEKVLSGETDVEYLRNLAMAQLDLIAADYKPRTAGEKISTVQIISHLLNARTAMRNLTSNQVFDMVDSLANNVGLLPDIIMGAITGQRSVGLNKSWASQQKRQGALQGAGRNLLEIALDAAPNDRNQSKYGTGGRRTFAMASSGTVGKILSQAERILGYELNTTDEFHKGSVYGETMESLARFVDRGDMTVEQAAEFATDMALYRSFQDSTVIGSILGGLKDVLNIIGTGTTNGKTIKGLPVHDFGLGDLVVKYTQVPGALIHRAIEFSPVGYLKAIYNIAQLGNLKSKGESTLAKQRAAALSIGRATTGTGLITLFALLAKAGLLRRKDDEKDKNAAALRQSQGFNGTQLNVSALGRMLSGGSLDVQEGDVLADIGFLEPLDSLMTIAALAVNDPEIKAMDLYDMFRNLKTAGKMGEKSLQGIWLALEDTSAMQTLSNIYSTVRYHDEANDLPLYMQIPMEIAASSVSGFIPAPIRQIAQATDTVYRDQYRSQNLLEQTAAKVANAIPGVRQQLAPKLTPLGEEKAYQAPALNALNALLSPGNISVYHSTAVTDEFLRVYDETGEAKILPERNAPYSITINKEKYTLTPDERTQYQETRGKVTTQFADAVRKSKWYKALPADEQAEVLNWCGNFANYVAKTAFMTERGEEYTSKTYAKYYDEWQSGASPDDVAAKANKQNPDGTASRSVPTLKLPTA